MWLYKKIQQLTDIKVATLLYYFASILIFFLFAMIGFVGNNQWRYGILVDSPNDCIDYNPCTLDVLFPDDTCEFRPKRNGTLCGGEDRCYWHSGAAETNALVCIDQKCVGPDKTTCKGYCTIRADCSDMMDSLFLPSLLSLKYTTYTQCISHGCVAYLILPNTTLNRDASTYLDHSSSIDNRFQTKCLHSSCTTLANSSTICTYYYHCAPVFI